MKNRQEYILLAGYRRYTAMKKLGWKKTWATVYGSDRIEELQLDDIELGDNSRKDESSATMIELMNSIKQNGLIQPIVVAKSEDLTTEDFVALNLTENIQRKDLSPFEVSMRIKRLKSLGLNDGEISARLGITKEKVRSLINISKAFTEKDLDKVSFISKGETASTKGKISYTLAKNVARSRIGDSEKRKLLETAGKEEFSAEKIDIIVRLINGGLSQKQAMRQCDSYERTHPIVIIRKDFANMAKKKYNLKSNAGVVIAMLKGVVPIQKDAIFQTREFNSIEDD